MTALSRTNSFFIGVVTALFHMAQGKAIVLDFLGSPEGWMIAMVAVFAGILLGTALIAFLRFVFELEERSTNLVAAGLGVLALPALYFHSHPALGSGDSAARTVWLSFTLASVPLMGCGAIVAGPLRRGFDLLSAVSGGAVTVAVYAAFLEPLGVEVQKGAMVAALLVSLVCLAAGRGLLSEKNDENKTPGWAPILCAATAVCALCSFASLVSLNLPILPVFWAPLVIAALSGLAIGIARPAGLWPERLAIAAAALLAPVLYYETRLLPSIAWLAGIAACVFFVFELCGRRTARVSSSYGLTLVWLIGTVAGSAFALFVAPEIFLTSAELPLALVLIPLLTPGTRLAGLRLMDLAPALAMLACFIALMTALRSGASWSMAGFYCVLGAIAAFGARPFQTALSLASLYMLLGTVYHLGEKDVLVRRNRFGTVRVFERSSEDLRIMTVGTTIMGFQRMEGPDRLVPTGVMSRSGPVSDVFGAVYAGTPAARGIAIGIGAGAVACFPPKEAPFFVIEPNKTVVAIAKRDRYFSYVRDCSATVAAMAGDPVIEPDAFGDIRFDLIFTSAFTGLGVPVHLLTTEQLKALALLLNDDGVMATLVVDPFVDAEAPLAAAARENGMSIIVNEIRSAAENEIVNPAKLFVMGKGGIFDEIASRPGWRAAEAGDAKPWTENHAEILSHLAY